MSSTNNGTLHSTSTGLTIFVPTQHVCLLTRASWKPEHSGSCLMGWAKLFVLSMLLLQPAPLFQIFSPVLLDELADLVEQLFFNSEYPLNKRVFVSVAHGEEQAMSGA